jgi:RNA polymerase sigma-70 factor (ECF subfamily)
MCISFEEFIRRVISLFGLRYLHTSRGGPLQGVAFIISLAQGLPSRPYVSESAKSSDIKLSRYPAESDEKFERFFRQFEPYITGFLWRLTRNGDVTCDLCQETFIRAWQNFDQICALPRPESWLFRVATNLVINNARHATSIPLSEQYHPNKSDPGNRYIEDDFVHQILNEMTYKQRALLILRDVNGFSYQEIGQFLGMSANAVKTALARAREQFRIRYCRKDKFPS